MKKTSGPDSNNPKPMSPGFRPVEEWRAALMALPDQNFFELLRSVFGNIKTPFNKQRLMDDLYALLSREDIRQTIAGYIDEKDNLVIAAVSLLNSPKISELENFFSPGLPYGELHSLVRNLEERLILFRFDDGEGRRMALNPALQSVLSPIAADMSGLFPSSLCKAGGENSKAVGPVFTSDNRVIASLFAFLKNEKNFFKAGGIRKKSLDEGKQLFPGIDLEIVTPVLERLGLFNRQEEAFVPEKKRIEDFCGLNPRERQEYWAAALYLHLNEDQANAKTVSPWESYNYSRLKEISFLIHGLLSLLDPERCYPRITLRRYACLLSQGYSNKDIWSRRFYGDAPELHLDHFLESMEKCGLLCAEDEVYRGAGAAKDSARAGGKDEEEKAVIAMDSPSSFILYPDITLSDALAMSSFCEMNSDGGYTLTRPSVIHYFDQGFNSADLMELLNRLSGGRLDSSLEFTLKDWEARYTSVSLYRGEVLVLAEDRRYLADVRPLSSMIGKTLAPGVYLLRSDSRRDIAKVLLKAGVDIFSQASSEPDENRIDSYRAGFYPSPKRNFLLPAVFKTLDLSGTGRTTAGISNNQAELKQRFAEHLKKVKLSDMEKEELSARIERKLVLTETQLETSSLKYEKLEARGLDYNGKNVLARQAISTGSLVEVTWTESGTARTIAGIALLMEKQGTESILIVQSNDDAGGDIHIPLRKISRLRRIKQSIFEG